MWEDVALGIVIVCGANLFFGSILGFIGYLRYLKHKETIALANNGLLDISANKPTSGNPQAIRSGFITMAVGLALCIGLYPIGWIADIDNLPLNMGPWMLAGLVPFFVGAAIVVSNYLPGIQDLVGNGVRRVIDEANADQHPVDQYPADQTIAGELSTEQPLSTSKAERRVDVNDMSV